MTFKLDMHVHTRYSGDNDSDPEEMLLAAIERGLDGIVFTEHYSYEASEYAERLSEKYAARIAVFRGVEFSAEEGHCLVYGANTDRLNIKGASVGELVRAVREEGGEVVPSHPYRRGSGIGDTIKSLRDIPAIEGYNGCNMHIMNMMAVEAASALGLPITGGSDAHAPEEVGGCYTEFEVRVTAANFMELLREGRYAGVDARKVSTRPTSLKWLLKP